MRLAGAVALLLLLPLLLVVVVAAAVVAPLPVGEAGSTGPPLVPAEQLTVMLEVSTRSGVPWELLAATASVDSGPGADPYEYRDAIATIASHLIAAGVVSDIPQAVYAYSHSWQQVSLVLARARFYRASGLVPQPSSAAALEVAP